MQHSRHNRREIRRARPAVAPHLVNSLRRGGRFPLDCIYLYAARRPAPGDAWRLKTARVGNSVSRRLKGAQMAGTKTISGEFEAMLPALADTMRYATQALAQSAAVYEVLIAKGLATKEELEAALCSSVPIEDQFAALDLNSKEN